MVFLFAYLPAVLLGFSVLPRPMRNPFLLIVNLIFYGWGEPVYILLMVLATVVNYALGHIIGRTKQTRPGIAKLCVGLAVVFSILMLGYFKYAGFLAGLWNSIPFLPDISVPAIALPIGISFYTFQTMSYTIDVYREDAEVQRSLVDFGVYVTLFPQLIAGPIVRYKDVADQLDGNHPRAEQFALGVRLFIIGLCKKVLIANRMGLLWDTLRPNVSEYGVIAAWVGIIGYTMQIYFDFSGYSDMARGLGKMLGFDFMENFRYPYISASITEFWRRWHISLSTWFRDYVYIPLGGNRVKPVRMYMNLFAVWFLTGLWHGASMNFILWGLYYFAILVIEKRFLMKYLDRLPGFLRHVYTMFLVILGWVLFYFDTGLSECFSYLSALFGNAACLVSGDALNIILRYAPIIIAAAIAATPLCAGLWRRIEDKKISGVIEIVLCMAGLVLCTAVLASQSYNPFLYFKF